MQQPANTYEIRVEGRLDQRWLEGFDAITIAYGDNDETILRCAMRDQAGAARRVEPGARSRTDIGLRETRRTQFPNGRHSPLAREPILVITPLVLPFLAWRQRNQ